MGRIVRIAEAIEDAYYGAQNAVDSVVRKMERARKQKRIDAENAKIAPTCEACGKKAIVDPEGNGYWRCPTEYNGKGEVPLTLHCPTIQNSRKFKPGYCTVVKEEGGYRPQWDDYDQCPQLFATELEAWREMDKSYWGHSNWDDEREEPEEEAEVTEPVA